MMITKYPKKEVLEELFEIRDGELWRLTFTRKNGRTIPERKIINKNNHGGYCHISFIYKKIYYHTIVWILSNGDIPDGFVIDHIDGDKINNNINNLRIVTQRKNTQNRDIHRGGSLFGGYFDKTINKWRGRIYIDGKGHDTGYFNTKQEAHEAYLKAEKELEKK